MTGNSNEHAGLALGIPGFVYQDLHNPERLIDLLQAFDQSVREKDSELFSQFQAYRENPDLSPETLSELLVQMAPQVGAFVAKLFQVENLRDDQLKDSQDEFETVFKFKNDIVSKLNARFKGENLSDWDIQKIEAQFEALCLALIPKQSLEKDAEKEVAALAIQLSQLIETADAQETAEIKRKIEASNARVYFADADVSALLECICRWSYAATQIDAVQSKVANWVSLKSPGKTDFNHLVEHELQVFEGYSAWKGCSEEHKRRDGFSLTDKRFEKRRVLYEVDHCIYCHDRDTDSCSKGMRNRKDKTFKVNSLGATITGCPLEEKISEMHVLKRQGDDIGALALIAIDNPMCPGTGHRICNDCMRGCIFQKTSAVDIPQIETNVLTSVLFMPWGFEIYSLLTRWNPLNVKRPYALPYNGKKVLVVGMGPAGYTLSHYLLNEGFGVVGIDALKIEPLPESLLNQPISDFSKLYEDLDKRVMLGFGGVAEYGITVRWDKNFLKVIYLNLLRHQAFRCYGGVRFGGTLTVDEAFEMGFDHIAIASGAGKPTVIDLKNNLTRGIRKASDFLMGLQLTGAAKKSSLANLQVRLPAGVIGGGLTAIDTATELLAYYPIQVEKILHRYETLRETVGVDTIKARYDEEEMIILNEFLEHGQAIRAERQRAESAGEIPHFLPLLESWGGVTMFYRKGIKDSPAYRQNHEEITHGLNEGIWLAEGMSPLEAIDDRYGHIQAVRFEKLEEQEGRWKKTSELEVPLKSLFVAAGTSPNTIYQSEYPDTFVMDKKFYQRYEPENQGSGLELKAMADVAEPKIGKPAPFTSYQKDGKHITFYGDNHPVYAGNVVKAMASAKNGYPYIVDLFKNEIADLKRDAERDHSLIEFQSKLDEQLRAQIVEIKRLTNTIIEIVVKAPAAAKHFKPGQFYRVQNYESLSKVVNGTPLATEGLALTGAWVDKQNGLISLIALEMGSSSRLCASWKAGDPILIMGVTGAPTDIPKGKTILLLGGGLGNAVLFSIGKALREAGNKVIYFAGYRNREDVFKTEEIEPASDLIVWSVDKRPGNEAIVPSRAQDKTFVGNIIESMIAYAKGELGEPTIRLDEADHMIVIGSDRMMAAVKAARFDALKPYLKEKHEAIGSINSPMQCMMKGVCAQCLCKHIDPETGNETFVYSCNNQDQDLDHVDFPNLAARLKQNSVQEKLSSLWLDHLLENE